MDLIVTIAALIALTGINIYTLHSHGKQAQEWQNERKDLYDRIMSKDLQEYKWNTEEVKIYAPVSKDDNELYEQEIEDNKM